MNIKKKLDKLTHSPNNVTIHELKAVLEYFGFRLIRINGSHFIFKNQEGISKSVPVHNNKIKPYYIKDILKLIYEKYKT